MSRQERGQLLSLGHALIESHVGWVGLGETDRVTSLVQVCWFCSARGGRRGDAEEGRRAETLKIQIGAERDEEQTTL